MSKPTTGDQAEMEQNTMNKAKRRRKVKKKVRR